MFTSGSTGEPKGAVIPHRAIVRLVKTPGYMQFSDDQVFLQSSPLSFDASIFLDLGRLAQRRRIGDSAARLAQS
jgi:non-ribosomal peptide synthetase component F